MSEVTTVRSYRADPAGAGARQESLQTGNRHRCARCQARGEQGEPACMCHHCGRLLCARCQPKPGRLGRLFQHQELKSISGRGLRRSLVGSSYLEAVHCDACRHPAPRMGPWLLLHALGAFLVMALFYFAGWSPAFIVLMPLLYFVGATAAGFLWRELDRRYREQLFFPLDAGQPTLSLQEEFVADGVLDGHYEERFRPGMPRGVLRATVPLPRAMGQELDLFARLHGLTEQELEEIPATAGAVALEKVERVLHPDPPWPARTSRRWRLTAPLPRWRSLWSGEGPPEETLEFYYGIDWQVPRRTFDLPFPIQVQAHFPEQSDRRTLELGFALTDWSPSLSPSIRSISLAPGEGAPSFSLLPVPGRPISQRSHEEIEIRDLPFQEDGIAHLQLRFNAPLPGNTAAWLTGTVEVGLEGTFSGMEIAAFYNAFGHRDSHPQLSSESTALLHFRVNVTSIPYQRMSSHSGTITLRQAPVERDDAILEALARESRLIQVRESALEGAHEGNGSPVRAPLRDVMGQWTMPLGDRLAAVLYHAHFLPTTEGTQIKLHVEAPVTDPLLAESRAREIWQQLSVIVERADQDYHGGDAPTPRRPAGPGGTLLSKLRGER